MQKSGISCGNCGIVYESETDHRTGAKTPVLFFCENSVEMLDNCAGICYNSKSIFSAASAGFAQCCLSEKGRCVFTKVVKRFVKLYRWVMLSMAVCIAVLAIAAGYTVGVVSQNNVIAQIDVNIGSIETYLEKNHNATQLLTDEFKEDYSAKTRTIAMLLAQDSSFITDDRTLEELRVTVNADMISVADADGNVVASTDPSGAGTSIREEFRSHLEEDVYTDALFLLDSDTPTIVAASSLDGGHGMVQITFSADSVVSLLQDADLANIASSMPLYSSGTTAILEADTMKYISCTDTDLIGQTADFDKSSMKRNKGKFDVKDADGKTNMVHYQSSGDYIIMATVPYAEVYRVRNIVVGWVIGGGIGILAVTCLALRMELLRQDAKNAKK